MNTNKDNCPICQGTGLTRSGHLDCSYNGCTAAIERAAFNEKLGISGPWMLLDVAWQAYRMGQQSREVPHAV